MNWKLTLGVPAPPTLRSCAPPSSICQFRFDHPTHPIWFNSLSNFQSAKTHFSIITFIGSGQGTDAANSIQRHHTHTHSHTHRSLDKLNSPTRFPHFIIMLCECEAKSRELAQALTKQTSVPTAQQMARGRGSAEVDMWTNTNTIISNGPTTGNDRKVAISHIQTLKHILKLT